MNHTYRLVFNRSQNAWVAVAETAKSRTKSGKAKAAGAAVASVLAFNAFAMPTGGQVSAGAGSIAQSGNTMTVTQTSQNLAINWNSFGIAAHETVDFAQPSASAIALNRVLGSDPSAIYGKLNANGQVFLLNPNGVLFGKTAQVNVGGLVASTLNLSDADFMARNFRFTGTAGSVKNEGALNAADNGYVALLGGQVSNQGSITARLGNVSLAAGSDITLDFAGDQLIRVKVDKGALNALAENKQLIVADGGTVLLTAQAANALIQAVVNNEGVIEAQTVENKNGAIRLMGDMQNGVVNVAGTLDASAPSGGNGGFIETSAAKVKVADGARITTQAAHGLTGSWLLDPVDFTVAASGGDITGSALGTLLGSNSVTLQTTTGTDGATDRYGTRGTNGDINVLDAVSWSANNTLTLRAYRNIHVNALITGSGTGSKVALEYGQGAVNLYNKATYDFGLTNAGFTGRIDLQAGNNFSTKLGSDGPVITYTVVTSLGTETSSHDGTLQGIVGNLSGNYALGANINAAGTSTWNFGGVPPTYAGFEPIGGAVPFAGAFEGLGHTIDRLSILHGRTNGTGLFGVTSDTARISNVGLTNVSIKSGVSNTGSLVGMNSGSIANSYATGTVLGGIYTGGLVGLNYGDIGHSHAACDVDAIASAVGGLVGSNGSISLSGVIHDSYATGNVMKTAWGTGNFGGLVGENWARIENTYATGAVGVDDGSGNSLAPNVGGLVGVNRTRSQINNSYATGSLIGADYVGGLVGLNDGDIYKSYATGSVVVSGGTHVGGLVGSASSGSNADGIWNTETSGQSTSAGDLVRGMTSAEMKQAAMFTTFAWDTATGSDGRLSWIFFDGQSAPLLRSLMTPLTITANNAAKTYDGTAYSGGAGVGYSVAPIMANLLGTLSYTGTSQGATNAGSYAIKAGGVTSVARQDGYLINYADGTLTINPAPIVPVVTCSPTCVQPPPGPVATTVSGSLTGTVQKTYDGTNAATLASGNYRLSGFVGSDGATVTKTAGTYASSNAGSGIAVTVSLGTSDYAATGTTNLGNYLLPTSITGNVGVITPRALSVSGSSVASKTYDGTTTASLTAGSLSGLVGSETLGLSISGAFDSKNAGSRTVAAHYELSNGSGLASNYSVTDERFSAVITPKALTVSGIVAANKTYDGTTAATVSTAGAKLDGLVMGDAVGISASGAFADMNAGTGKTVTLVDTLTGADAGNYSLTAQASTTADIAPKALSIAGSAAQNKQYDGTTKATVTPGTLAGFVGKETVTVGESIGTFGDATVGDRKKVAAHYVLANGANGGLAGNYSLADETLLANITPAESYQSAVSSALSTTGTSTGGTLPGTGGTGGAGGSTPSDGGLGSGLGGGEAGGTGTGGTTPSDGAKSAGGSSSDGSGVDGGIIGIPTFLIPKSAFVIVGTGMTLPDGLSEK